MQYLSTAWGSTGGFESGLAGPRVQLHPWESKPNHSQKRRMASPKTIPYGDFDREVDFDSHKWSCSKHGIFSIARGQDRRF